MLIDFLRDKAMNLMHREFTITGNVPEEILANVTDK
jgi:hypothetical protein